MLTVYSWYYQWICHFVVIKTKELVFVELVVIGEPQSINPKLVTINHCHLIYGQNRLSGQSSSNPWSSWALYASISSIHLPAMVLSLASPSPRPQCSLSPRHQCSLSPRSLCSLSPSGSQCGLIPRWQCNLIPRPHVVSFLDRSVVSFPDHQIISRLPCSLTVTWNGHSGL